ncbi:MAG: hypothetical protein ACI4LM_07185 [Anaerovoracaceae bacterium]
MKRKRWIFLIIILCLAIAVCVVLLIKTRSGSQTKKTNTGSSSVTEEQNGSGQDTEQADEETQTEDSNDSEQAESSDTSGNSEDPANYDPTENASANSTVSAVKQKAIGKWKRTGIKYSDGSIQGDDTSCVYNFKSDGTYSADGKNADGKSYNKNGTWKVNSKKKIVLSDSVKLAFNDDGDLMQYTGYRDGKGNRLYYVYTKK